MYTHTDTCMYFTSVTNENGSNAEEAFLSNTNTLVQS